MVKKMKKIEKMCHKSLVNLFKSCYHCLEAKIPISKLGY